MEKQRQITEWFDLYKDDIYRFLLYRLRSNDVEDCVQEVFIRAFRFLETFDGHSHPKTWLITIARNVAIDELRKQQRKRWTNWLSFEAKHEPTSNATPDQILHEYDEAQELMDIIRSLKPPYNEVLILRGVNGFSTTETAEALQWSEAKVRTTYHRAKQALRQRIGGEKYA